ncbi:MAG: isoprenylcysteine carboxylmethyltransferase family protein [Candidatus Aminicenantes bacterium]|nr:isoprenylcysteine carboxylmethyltransferase family protein [Candidatus Aminicenantes bacterium]
MSIIPAFKIGIWNAWIFMSVFLIQMLIIILINRQISEKSHIPREFKRSKREKFAASAANYTWLAAMFYSIFLPLRLGTLWFYAGLAFFAIGLILLAASTIDFISTPTHKVITRGIYRFSRHPMYLAISIICLGSGLASASWLFLFISIIMALCFYQEAQIEEKYCLETYGQPYQKYLNKTPKWLGLPKKSE